MFTENGMGMAVGVAWCFAAVMALLLSLEAKKSKEHRIYGTIASLICFLLGLHFLLNRMSFAFLAAVIAAGQLLGRFVKWVTTEK